MKEIAKTVLVVDDNADVRELIILILQSHGLHALAAENGSDALSVLHEQPCDLVLLDLMMPGISGLEVVKKIREVKSSDDLPIVMITAQTSIADVEKAIQCGANSYLIKPFKADEIVHHVYQLLGDR